MKNPLYLDDLIKYFEKKLPLKISLPPDKNGLKFGEKNKKINNILSILEVNDEVIEYAIKNNIDLIFTHHDPFFMGINNLTSKDKNNKNIIKLIENNISLYAAHTNLDIMYLNDYLFNLLGGINGKILEKNTKIGRYGFLKAPMSLQNYINYYVLKIQKKEYIRIVGNFDKIIKKISVINGKGNSYINNSINKNVDLIITGDINYHDAIFANNHNISIIDIGHDIEYIVQDVFNGILNEIKKENNLNFNIVEHKFDFYPFKLVK